jgi:hypothetical protein
VRSFMFNRRIHIIFLLLSLELDLDHPIRHIKVSFEENGALTFVHYN